jgi:hypothetical protein
MKTRRGVTRPRRPLCLSGHLGGPRVGPVDGGPMTGDAYGRRWNCRGGRRLVLLKLAD